MTAASTPSVFLTDPSRFMKIVLEDDPRVRSESFDNPDDLILCEAVRYGIVRDDASIPDLIRFYRHLAMRLPVERRFAIFNHLAGLVENVSAVTINAFLPFITEDDARMVVATAVVDYVSQGGLTDGDPMSRVKDIVRMIEGGRLRNEGAAFGALLNLGDDRVCRLLAPLRDSLPEAALHEAIGCSTGFIHAATAEFYLDWLEGLEGHDEDGVFGTIVGGLALLKKSSRSDRVSTGHRPFPMTGVTRSQFEAMTKHIPLSDYAKRIAPRMHALERAEPPPRTMPHALTAWGLAPLTDPAEFARVDDRVVVGGTGS